MSHLRKRIILWALDFLDFILICLLKCCDKISVSAIFNDHRYSHLCFIVPTKSIKGLMALALTSLEKIGLEFFSQKNSKSLSFFLQKLEVFCGVKPGPFGPPTIHLTTHEKKLGGCYQEY